MELRDDIEKIIKNQKSTVNVSIYYFSKELNPICMLEKRSGLNETQQSAQ